MTVLTLSENKKGRDFVVGDIHGAFDLLDKALLAVHFDPEKDRLIAVGDLVDRGPRSADCHHYLAQPWFYSVRGNHEKMFMTLYRDGKLDVTGVAYNIPNGMKWMWETPLETLEKIRTAFKKLPVAIEIETPEGIVGVVHGNVPEGMNWGTFKQKLLGGDKEVKRNAVLERTRIETANDSGVKDVLRVFFGHTPVEGGPKKLGNCFFIDTGAVFELTGRGKGRDFFMTLIDIRANANDICSPKPTSEKLVRTATVKKPAAPHA